MRPLSQEAEKEMDRLVEDGAFVPSGARDVICSPVFVIPKKNGGVRMIHDLGM